MPHVASIRNRKCNEKIREWRAKNGSQPNEFSDLTHWPSHNEKVDDDDDVLFVVILIRKECVRNRFVKAHALQCTNSTNTVHNFSLLVQFQFIRVGIRSLSRPFTCDERPSMWRRFFPFFLAHFY